jgi:hypothetical protein
MKKMIWKGAQAYLLHCYSMEGVYDETKYPKGLDKMLEKYNTIFQDLPHGLPLVWSRDHIIELIPGSTPVRRKSYKQSHQHKTKLSVLGSRIIRLWYNKPKQEHVFNASHTSKEKGWLL